MRLPESQVDDLAGLSQVEYIEKPKRLYFEVNRAIRDTCIAPVQSGNQVSQNVYGRDADLSGRGTLTAIIDSGIDYFHPDFRNADGTTRIAALWDQEQNRIYTREELNRALEAGSRERAYEIVQSRDVSGHGTAVAAIAAGNGWEGGGHYRGVAWESELLVVKLGTPLADSFPRTTELMRALDYVVGIAQEWRMPVAVNLSFGNTYGSHDGTSLLETYLNSMAERGRTSIIVGTGNEGYSMGHRAGFLQMGRPVEIELGSGGIFRRARCAAMEIVSGPVFSRNFQPGRQQHRGDPGNRWEHSGFPMRRKRFFYIMGCRVHTVRRRRFIWI